MPVFTVDQSGKAEGSMDTVVALCSSEIQYAIRVPARVKQGIFSQCMKSRKTRLAMRIFSFAVALLAENRVGSHDIVLIDDEYPGHEADIKNHVLHYASSLRGEQLRFCRIGKHDRAHRVANQTFSGKLKPNQVLGDSEINLARLLPKRSLKNYLR